jgi:hypothetical protein
MHPVWADKCLLVDDDGPTGSTTLSSYLPLVSGLRPGFFLCDKPRSSAVGFFINLVMILKTYANNPASAVPGLY